MVPQFSPRDNAKDHCGGTVEGLDAAMRKHSLVEFEMKFATVLTEHQFVTRSRPLDYPRHFSVVEKAHWH